jgi:hypothetical protein
MTLPPRNLEKKGRDPGLRSPTHRKFVGQHLCVMHKLGNCEGRIDCCHCRDIAPRGHGGGKPGDQWCVSMCRKHHDESEKREHDYGLRHGVDFEALCMEFAAASPDMAIRSAAAEFRRSRLSVVSSAR